MIETEFKFNKKELVPKFKEYIGQYRDDDNRRYEPKNAKEVEYSKYDILKKIRNIYMWAFNESVLELRNMYNHDESKFIDVKNKILDYINNKIRSTSDGSIYLKVHDFETFNGEKDQYEEWVVKNKKNQERLIRKIVDELNAHIEGILNDDDNKPILNDEEFNPQDDPVAEAEFFANSLGDEFYEELFDNLNQPKEVITYVDNDRVEEMKKEYVEKVTSTHNISEEKAIEEFDDLKNVMKSCYTENESESQ